MTRYQGEVVRFVAQQRATCHGRRYNAGDAIRIVLAHDWCEEDGLGAGGPWGWGGYTTRKIKTLGPVKGEGR